MPGIGNFDFVIVKHKPLSNIVDDFAVIEFQTGQTTSTGKLVDGFKKFMKDGFLKSDVTYNFGVNSYDIWKRTFTQVLNKGIIFEKWKRKIYWVIQEPIFDYFENKYRLGSLKYNPKHATVFILYDLIVRGNQLTLSHKRTCSESIDDLFDKFRRNDDIPPVERFIKRLQSKLDSDIKLGLRLDVGAMPHSIDAPKPTSSGRVREDQEVYLDDV